MTPEDHLNYLRGLLKDARALEKHIVEQIQSIVTQINEQKRKEYLDWQEKQKE